MLTASPTRRRAGFVAITFLVSIGLAQTVPDTGATPETGYVSDSRYINAFFGFMLPLPHDADFHELPIRLIGSSHLVYGLQAQRNGLTVLWVQATKAGGSPSDAAQKAAAGPKGNRTKRLEIGGREFWKAESEEKSRAGKMHNVTYATAMTGYTLQFMVLAFDAKLGDELLRGIESISFFDPAQAKALAGGNARPIPATPEGTPAAPAAATHMGQLKLGTVSGNTFTNDTLGLSFQFPAGWVLADKTTQENVVKAGHQFMWGNEPAAAREHEASERCGRVLFWATKYPEGTKLNEINPLIAILAFDSACLPGVDLPKSTEDTEGIRQVALQILRSLSGTPFVGKGRNSVRAFTLQNRLLIDLSSAFTVEVPTRKQPFDVFTSMIITQADVYSVMWVFMNGSQSGLNQLGRDVRISFAPSVNSAEQK
jgi:hypothetical protein